MDADWDATVDEVRIILGESGNDAGRFVPVEGLDNVVAEGAGMVDALEIWDFVWCEIWVADDGVSRDLSVIV